MYTSGHRAIRAAFLRRLRKDRADIHARVLRGELSPHAGMIEAGFRKAPNLHDRHHEKSDGPDRSL